jgi:hypothetical protein
VDDPQLRSKALTNGYSRVLTVNVVWKATVRNDGRFFDCKVTGDKMVSLSTESPTDEDLEILSCLACRRKLNNPCETADWVFALCFAV